MSSGWGKGFCDTDLEVLVTKVPRGELTPGSTVSLYIRHESATDLVRALVEDGIADVSGYTIAPRPLRVDDVVRTPAGYKGRIVALYKTYAWVSDLKDHPVSFNTCDLRRVDDGDVADTLTVPAGEHHGA